MAARNSNKVILILLATFSILFGAESAQGWRGLSKEEDLELDRQLKLINKPAIKSFWTEYGDIVDCIDIYRQLAFDHPLLKNHTIQMKPTVMPKEMKNEKSTTDTYPQYFPRNIRCPQGSVAIRRTTKEDLIKAKSFTNSMGLKYPTKTHRRSSNVIQIQGHHSAVLEFRNRNHGGRGRVNIWNPSVTGTQYSVAGMWVGNGPRGPRGQYNSIQVGWGVNLSLYPNGSRLYAYWTADSFQKTGCFNLLCPGFIQVSPEVPLGLQLPISAYMGEQFDTLLSLHQDGATGNWWFMFEDKYIGYYPKAIFTSLKQGASCISWGGEVYSPATDLSPAMGSGHFPQEGRGKSAYISQIKVVTDQSGAYGDPPAKDPRRLKIYADKRYCYNAIHSVEKADMGHHVYFGGPGNCTF